MKVFGRLRKGDELQDAFFAFRDMIERLREDRREKAEGIGEVIEEIGSSRKITKDQLEKLKSIRERMLSSLAD